MRLSIVNHKLDQKILSLPIYNLNGTMYMNKGMKLNSTILDRIRALGINMVYIEDGDDKVALQETLDYNTKTSALRMLKQEFESIIKTKRVNEEVFNNVLNMIIENMDLSENAFSYNNIAKTDNITELVLHSINVTVFALAIGAESNYNDTQLSNLGMGALLHDIGKLVTDIPGEHPAAGYKIARENRGLSPLSTISILQHHEQIDGKGYPGRISGEKLHEFTKIISVSNSYAADLSSDNQMLPNAVLEKIVAGSSTKFDLDIIKRFTNAIYCYPNGLTVKLNTGETGTVIKQNKGFPSRPFVQVKKSGGVKDVDLMEELTVFIEKVEI